MDNLVAKKSSKAITSLPIYRIRIRGLVQGVGFRPHVYRLALEHNIRGFVKNDGMGVVCEVQGKQVHQFVERIKSEAPPLARIDSLEFEEPITKLENISTFIISESSQTAVTTSIVPDAAVCDACINEATTKSDKRYLYPFLNCTHCGPRYTITKSLPYDRKQTSMVNFPMCDACLLEYNNPLDRRFHAQPTACATCGPQLSQSIASVVELIKNGKIVALKGLGGFHLICDATNNAAVNALRNRKHRDGKPFAIMVANIASARKYVHISACEQAMLQGKEHPVVLLRKHEGAKLLGINVALNLNTLGVMLPYTPLHHLLFFAAVNCNPLYKNLMQELTLVATSANTCGEPLVIDNNEAYAKLSGIADAIVTHNRDILIRVDDSVLANVQGERVFIRRARGFVPEAIELPFEVPPLIAFGSDLKNTICITRGKEAFVSQHIGDLDNEATLAFQRETILHLTNILSIKPVAVVTDLHPDFLSSHEAKLFDLPVIKVQHHHAHIAAVCAEYKTCEPVLGVALDGFGLGLNREAWGGELLLVTGAKFTRVGHLQQLLQPGGDKAAREPWRMGAAVLHMLGLNQQIASYFTQIPYAHIVATALEKNINCVPTSSAGRLFDAACGLLKVCPMSEFEGQAPMFLEALVTKAQTLEGGFTLSPEGVLSLLPLLKYLSTVTNTVDGANIFHGTLAAALVHWIEQAALKFKISTVVLAGGCFLNRVLLSEIMNHLTDKNIKLLIPRKLPPNDGAISLGQAFVAAQTLLH